jgi:hypothetical protein
MQALSMCIKNLGRLAPQQCGLGHLRLGTLDLEQGKGRPECASKTDPPAGPEKLAQRTGDEAKVYFGPAIERARHGHSRAT